MMTEGPLVQIGDIAIRPMRDDEDDYSLMAKWLTDERVLEFYEGRDNPHNIEKVREKYGPRTLSKDRVVPCIMVYQGRPIGYIQYYPVNQVEAPQYEIESDEGVYGVDLFLGEPAYWNKGIGTRALSALLAYLFDSLGATRVVIDPHVSNHRAIRSYEKCGFRKIKVLPRHELHEGEYRDAWLMAIDRDSHRNLS